MCIDGTDMTHCGRIYINPLNKREIYINIGNMFEGKQLYPSYEPWLSAFITEGQYNEMIDALKRQFADAPCKSQCPMICTCVFCLMLGGPLGFPLMCPIFCCIR